MYNYLQVWVIAPLLELILSNYENRLKSFHVNFNLIRNIFKQSNCTLDFGKYSWDSCRPRDSWGMWRIECCSDIFPIPLNPTKSGHKINCGLQTNKVDDWNVWYSKHPPLDCPWLDYWPVTSVLTVITDSHVSPASPLIIFRTAGHYHCH